jgi:hypothetical protein
MRDGEQNPGYQDVAFSLLRALVLGHCLWGQECQVSIAELARSSPGGASVFARAIAHLWDLNLVLLDDRRHTIRLSHHGVQQLITVTKSIS